MSDLTRYTYEVYGILHGDWNGVVPDGAFLATIRPGWLVPDSTLQDIAKILPDLIELAAEGIGYTSDYFRDKWEMDERLEEIVENPVIVELLNDDS